jgi:hypothetical protein
MKTLRASQIVDIRDELSLTEQEIALIEKAKYVDLFSVKDNEAETVRALESYPEETREQLKSIFRKILSHKNGLYYFITLNYKGYSDSMKYLSFEYVLEGREDFQKLVEKYNLTDYKLELDIIQLLNQGLSRGIPTEAGLMVSSYIVTIQRENKKAANAFIGMVTAMSFLSDYKSLDYLSEENRVEILDGVVDLKHEIETKEKKVLSNVLLRGKSLSEFIDSIATIDLVHLIIGFNKKRFYYEKLVK